MKEELLQLPATIDKVETMANRCLRLKIDTQENLSDEEMMKIVSKADKLGWFTFLVGEQRIDPEDTINLPEIKTEKGEKSPSKRLHDRMAVYYKSKHKNMDGFDTWYISTLNKIGQTYLDKMQ